MGFARPFRRHRIAGREHGDGARPRQADRGGRHRADARPWRDGGGPNIRHAVFISVYLEVNAGCRSRPWTWGRSSSSPRRGRQGHRAHRPLRHQPGLGELVPARRPPAAGGAGMTRRQRHFCARSCPRGPVCYKAGEWADHTGEPCRARRMAAEGMIGRHGCDHHDVGTDRRGCSEGRVRECDARRRRYRQAFRDAGRRADRGRSRLAHAWRRASSWAIIGPSGCGKSTLFNVIGGLLDGYEGTVRSRASGSPARIASIGMIFQEELTFPWRNVIDNVAFPLEIAGLPKARAL